MLHYEHKVIISHKIVPYILFDHVRTNYDDGLQSQWALSRTNHRKKNSLLIQFKYLLSTYYVIDAVSLSVVACLKPKS